MSINNPFSSQFGLKIDPDDRQDRRCSDVVPRKMTPEEIEMYGNVGVPYKKASMVAVESMARKDIGMKKLDIDRNELLEVCRVHGTGSEGYKAVAEKIGITVKQAENQVYIKKVRRQLLAESSTQNQVGQNVINKIAEPKPETEVLSADEVKTLSPEDEIFDKIKSIIDQNKKMKAMVAENEALRNMISTIHGKLQEIISEIKKEDRLSESNN